MKTGKNNLITEYISGAIGKQFVIKHYKGKTLITKFPDMSHVVRTQKQKANSKRFAQAVAFAKNINNTPQLKMQWQQKSPIGSSVYQEALKWYLANNM